jgi:hypothetical protein
MLLQGRNERHTFRRDSDVTLSLVENGAPQCKKRA